MKSFSAFLAVISALSFGFNLPAHAENSAKSRKPANASPEQKRLEDAHAKLLAQVSEKELPAFKIFDAQGNPTSFQKAMSDAKSFSEGFSIAQGNEKIIMKGEMLDEGKNGVLIMATHEVDGKILNGQVLTIKPGATKLEIESRLKDLIQSFATDYASLMKKPGAERKTASSPAVDALATGGKAIACVLTLAVTVLIAGLSVRALNAGLSGVVHYSDPRPKSGVSIAIAVALIASIAVGTGLLAYNVTCDGI